MHEFRQAAWHLHGTEVKGVAGLQKEDSARGGGRRGGGVEKSRES
jgi:hypothetical protein